ncbi:CZB domain-containing protein [Bacillus massiliigorillae]|uniref:CZB domain-containing protein n=1 Tax=Bacillus massiliigorillae TaxID=1243664 RepID=UPI003F6C8F83
MTSIADISVSLNNLSHETINAIHKLSVMINDYRNSIFSSRSSLTTRTVLELAKSDHVLWKWRIYNMLLGVETVRPTDVNTHMECRLGKWYFAPETREALKRNESYVQLDEYHKKVHDYAKEASKAYLEGDVHKAEAFFEELEIASHKVIELIDKIIKETCE